MVSSALVEIRALTGLRAPLAYLVAAYHFMPLREESPFWALLGPGHLAVDVFFVLSGYVLAKRYLGVEMHEASQRNQFWLRRFARLYPLYFVSLAIGIAAAWPYNLPMLTSTAGQLRTVLQLLLLNAWSHLAMFAPNWAAWSLSVEALFYLLFPALLLALRSRSARALWLVFVLACASSWIAPSVYTLLDPDGLGRPLVRSDQVLWSWYLKFFPGQRVPEFVAGICCALLARRLAPADDRNKRYLALLAVLGATVAGCAWLSNSFLFCGVLTPAFALLVWTLDRWGSAWLASRPMVALGHASYATYILHVPWYYSLRRLAGVDELDALQFSGYLGSLICLSLAAQRWVEEPLRKRISGPVSRRPELRDVPSL
jgi:peptidoglycan/LPS O-acetylase OafA/YrhL